MASDVVNLAKALVASGLSIPDTDLREAVENLATSEDEKQDDTDAETGEKVDVDFDKMSSKKTAGKTDTKDGK